MNVWEKLVNLSKKVYGKWEKINRDFELNDRLEFARLIVSVWSHACLADGELHPKEENVAQELIDFLFDDAEALFSNNMITVEQKTAIRDELVNVFIEPLSIENIARKAQVYVDNLEDLAEILYDDACHIVEADNVILEKEREFLDNLATELKLTSNVKDQIEKDYNI